MLIEPPVLQYSKYSASSTAGVGSSNHVSSEIYEANFLNLHLKVGWVPLTRTSDESFLSSAVRGTPGGLSLPPGQRLSRKRSRYDKSLGGASNILTLSRIFLLTWSEKKRLFRNRNHHLIVPPSSSCRIACRLNQLFFLWSSNTAKIRSRIGEMKVDVIISHSKGLRSSSESLQVPHYQRHSEPEPLGLCH